MYRGPIERFGSDAKCLRRARNRGLPCRPKSRRKPVRKLLAPPERYRKGPSPSPVFDSLALEKQRRTWTGFTICDIIATHENSEASLAAAIAALVGPGGIAPLQRLPEASCRTLNSYVS